jgi:hypothetical protein
MRPHQLLIALSLALAACGDSNDPPGPGPVTAEDAQALCGAACEREVMCDPGGSQTVEACTADCAGDVTVGWYRGDAFEALAVCIANLACTMDESACFDRCRPLEAHERFESQCRRVFAPCGFEPLELDGMCETQLGASVATDAGFFCLVIPSVMDELTACIPDGTACQAGIDCISGVLTRHNIDF